MLSNSVELKLLAVRAPFELQQQYFSRNARTGVIATDKEPFLSTNCLKGGGFWPNLERKVFLQLRLRLTQASPMAIVGNSFFMYCGKNAKHKG